MRRGGSACCTSCSRTSCAASTAPSAGPRAATSSRAPASAAASSAAGSPSLSRSSRRPQPIPAGQHTRLDPQHKNPVNRNHWREGECRRRHPKVPYEG